MIGRFLGEDRVGPHFCGNFRTRLRESPQLRFACEHEPQDFAERSALESALLNDFRRQNVVCETPGKNGTKGLNNG
jgi:hypothetical protein